MWSACVKRTGARLSPPNTSAFPMMMTAGGSAKNRSGKGREERRRCSEHHETAHAFLLVVCQRATPFSRQATRAAAIREGMLIPMGQ